MNELKRPHYFENIDALRAIAAIAVIFFHITRWFKFPETSFYEGLKFVLSFGQKGGELGVIFFFVLSGFLITYLMYSEQSISGTLNIPFFYVRRILRIWPLYYLTLLVGFFLFPMVVKIAGQVHTENASLLLYSVFATNFDHIYNGMPSTGILGVQWSVAIEEQFYLLWPLVFYFFNKKTFFPFLLLLIVIGSELFYIGTASERVRYFHLISNFRFLAFGGLLAHIAFFKKEYMMRIFNHINRSVHLVIYIVCMCWLLFQENLQDSFSSYHYVSQCLPFLFFGFVILEQNFSNNSFFKIGVFSWLNRLGKISYGLYLTHMIAIYSVLIIFNNSNEHTLIKIPLSLLITLFISYFSYTYFESFFLRLKNQFSFIGAPSKAFKVKDNHEPQINNKN